MTQEDKKDFTIKVNGKDYLFSSVCRSLGMLYSKLEKNKEDKSMGIRERKSEKGTDYFGTIRFLDIRKKIGPFETSDEAKKAVQEARSNLLMPFIEEAEKNEYIFDLRNKKIGNLTVMSPAGKSKSGLTTWECQCSCGNILTVEGSSIRRGRIKSCGCLRYTKTDEHREKIRISNLRENLSEEALLNKKKGSQKRSEQKEYREKLSIANRGEKAIAHKITEEDVRRIRVLWETGSYSTTAIADQFPISRQSVADIIYGRTWKYVS